MKRNFCILLFCFLLFNYSLYSQKKNNILESAFSEKIYIQLSSTVLTSDNTIWFKAIVTDVSLIPTRLSKVLHVELIDFDQRIISEKLLKLEKGIANGFFNLGEQLPAGRYQVRAYTHWNQNFGKNFISENYVDIYKPEIIKESEQAIQDITLTETSSGEFLLTAKAYPKILSSKFKNKIEMSVHTEFSSDVVELNNEGDDVYTFKYKLPNNSVNARIEIKLDSVTLKSYGKGFVNSYSKTVVVNKEYVDLQFFPEGGKLIEGLTSKVAFKALDYKGEGVVVSGFVVDQDDAIVMPFTSNKFGMGVTYLTPQSGKKYFATLKRSNDIVYKYKLPDINKQGVVLTVNEHKKNIILSLKSNEYDGNKLFVTISSRGAPQDSFSIGLKEGSSVTGLEKAVFPEGILKFRVTNSKSEIVCERLFFNYIEKQRVEITTTTNLDNYIQRGKTVIDLNTKDKDGNSIKSNLSVLVVNKNQLGEVHENRSDIVSCFFLNSELKGRIEKPTSYFDTNNKRRKHDMDILMLTQGWSNYIYDNKEELESNFEFPAEKGLVVSGTVKNLVFPNKKLKKPIELTMIYGPLNVLIQEVDRTGNFYFQLDDYYKDVFKVMIQSKSTKGKKKNYTIELDSYKNPDINFKKELHVVETAKTIEYIEKNIVRNEKVQDFEKSNGVVALDEVHLKGYKLTPMREKMMDRHGLPDVVIEEEELLKKKADWNVGLYSLLETDFPDKIEIFRIPPPPLFIRKNKFLIELGLSENDIIARNYDTDFTFIVIDGKPVNFRDYPYLDLLPVDAIKSVELLNKPKLSRLYQQKVFVTFSMGEEGDGIGEVVRLPANARTSILSIYTHSGKGYNGVQRSKGMYKGIVNGFATKREFYVPKYDTSSYNDWDMPDLRSVVYWAPNIETDADGNAQIEFYNGDDVGEMIIITEGITEDGKLGSSEALYTVDKR